MMMEEWGGGTVVLEVMKYFIRNFYNQFHKKKALQNNQNDPIA